MDRSLFVAANAATVALRAQAANSNNLANLSTTGFRAERVSTEALPLSEARQYSRTLPGGFDARDGAMQQTGNPLHVALQGDHWLEVMGPDGAAAYTRAGDLRLNANGQVVTGAGHPVQGDNGLLAIPPHEHVEIGSDGTISVIPEGAADGTLALVDRLRVVTVPPQELQRGEDGLMRLRAGAESLPSAGPVLVSGAIESSNVNATESLVRMIELSRQFELNVQLMRSVDDNARASSRLLQR